MKRQRYSIYQGLALLLALSMLLLALWGCESLPSKEAQNFSNFAIENGGRVTLEVGNTLQFRLNISDEYAKEVTWVSSGDAITVDQNGLVSAVREGKAAVTATYKTYSASALVEVISPSTAYDDAEKAAFYANYTVANSPEEAVRRSSLGLMSGELTVPDQAPTLSEFQPKSGDRFIRNQDAYYLNENTYLVVDAYGEVAFSVYRGGAYITLEEVAAYVFAFGEVPANYVEGKNAEPEESIWGEYLRLNHSAFSGNTKKYPYEPMLPDISGCGGELYYYEMDIGTTGTDCDPRYIAKTYNDGQTITRGAARIVYTRYDKNRNKIIDPDEKYLFYTYNHYNDFQEYLNYKGGWGEIFGNVTGGGSLSSKTDYNPTAYVPTVRGSLRARSTLYILILPYEEKRHYASFLAT